SRGGTMMIGLPGRLGGSAIVFFATVAVSCGGTKKIDGETHFLCTGDADCTSALGSDYGCVRSKCEKLATKAAAVVCYPGETSSCVGASGCSGSKTCADG